MIRIATRHIRTISIVFNALFIAVAPDEFSAATDIGAGDADGTGDDEGAGDADDVDDEGRVSCAASSSGSGSSADTVSISEQLPELLPAQDLQCERFQRFQQGQVPTQARSELQELTILQGLYPHLYSGLSVHLPLQQAHREQQVQLWLPVLPEAVQYGS